MLRGVSQKAKRNFSFLVVGITITSLVIVNFALPFQRKETRASASASISKTSTDDWNKGILAGVDPTGDQLKLSKTSGWSNENYSYREQLPVTAKSANAIPKGFTLNAAGIGSGTFDGSGDWFDLGDNLNSLNFPFSVESWVKVDGANNPGTIFTSDDNLSTRYCGFYITVEPTVGDTSKYAIGAQVGNNGGELSSNRKTKISTSTFNMNTWAHVAVIYRSINDFGIYINGVDAGGTFSGTATTMVHSTNPARIGRRLINAGYSLDFQMKGNIDELRIWSKERTLTEIQEDMYKEIFPQTNLEGYYTFDQTSGSLTDISGHNITGTAAGDASYSPYSNVWGGVNTKALIDSGKMRSDGYDLRMFYGSTEIERELIPATGKTLATSEATQVLFKSQAVVASGAIDSSYYIYYGDPDATDPVANVYDKKFRTKNAYIAPFSGNGANYLQYNGDNFPKNGDGTLEFWYKYSNTGSRHGESQSIFAGEDSQNLWSIWDGRWGYRSFAYVGGVAVTPSDPGNYNDGRGWNHTVITWHNTEANSQIRMYENNVLTASVNDGARITSWPSYMKFIDNLSSYDGIEMGLVATFNVAKDSTWVASEYTRSTAMPVSNELRDASATFIHNFDGASLDASSDNGGYASGTATAANLGTIISGDYRQGDTHDERAGNSWVTGVYNWFDNFDSVGLKSPGINEFGKINIASNELVVSNGQQALINQSAATMPANYRVDVSAKGTQPEILFNHQDKVGWWGNSMCATNTASSGYSTSDISWPRDVATGFISSNTSKYYLSMYNGWVPKYLQFDLSTNGSYTGLVWEYWNGSAWTAFTPASDGTASFTKSGVVDISNISASYGASAPADGDCGFNSNFNVIRLSASAVTTQAMINQINKIWNFAKLSYSATANVISGDSHNASGNVAVARATDAYKQIGLKRVGTGLQSYTDGRQIINTSTNATFDSNLLALSATTDATYDNLKIFKALTDEPSTSQSAENSKYPSGEVTDWYDQSWTNRLKVTIDHTKVPNTDQTDFPVLVKVSDQLSPLFVKAQADGDDILFTSSDGTTKLSHEIESYSLVSGPKTLNAWVKVPALSHTTDTVLYLYYGNASVSSQQNATDVWSDGYAGVWHMGNTSSPALDSTVNANNGLQSGGVTFGAAGKIGSSVNLNGSNYLDVGDGIDSRLTSSNISFSVLVNPNSNDGINNGIIGFGDTGSRQIWLYTNANGGVTFSTTSGGTNQIDSMCAAGSLVVGQWTHISGTYDGANVRLFCNNVPATAIAKTGALTSGSNNNFIGQINGYGLYNGKIDEAKVSTNVRSADWITTEYNNQNSPEPFESFGMEQSNVSYASPTSTTAGSGIIDTAWNGGWGAPDGFRANVIIPASTSIKFQLRSSATGGANSNDWTGWADAGTATPENIVDNVYTIQTASMPNITLGMNRYLQIRASLITVDGLTTPVLSDFTIFYQGDSNAPTIPAITSVNVGGNSVVDKSSIKYGGAANLNFSGSTDADSGVAGYYTYFGDNPDGVPSVYQAHSGAVGDVQTFSASITNADDGKYYYFKLKAVDVAGNVSAVTKLYEFGFDITPPVRPAFIATDPAGYTTQNSYTFTWPAATDPDGVSGNASGLKWYEYKRFTDIAWSHTSDATTTSISGIEAYQPGINGFYVRTVDNAGNVSDEQQVTYYSSGDAPPKPTNLTVDPTTSDQNAFTISWDKPDVGQGKPNVKGYWYSVNAAPTVNNVTFIPTTENHIDLGPLPLATLQGENKIYVLAEDQSGNKSYESAFVASETFNCQTPAPPTPTAVSIYDSSDRAINRWMLTTQWLAGPNQNDESFDHYLVERSTDGFNYSFLATTTSNAYIDSENLSNDTTYLYRIKAVDSAGKESVASTTVSKQPTGKYLTPPNYEGDPTAIVKANTATITWYTDRDTSSFVKYGISENSLLESKGQFDKLKKHVVELTGLTPGQVYYYKVQSVDEDRDYTLDSAYSDTFTLTTLSAPTISNVAINNVTLSSAEISFETTTMSNSIIKYGPSTNYSSEIEDRSGSGTTLHRIQISSLENGTNYHFKIFGEDADGNVLLSDDYSFETLPMPVVSDFKITEVPDKSSYTLSFSWTTNVDTSTILNYAKDGEPSKEKVSSKQEKIHSIEVSGLLDQSSYLLEATGRDQFGNLAKSTTKQVSTPKDSRPPKLTDLAVESKIDGTGQDARAQIIISWKSDEPATSQIEYSVGSGSDQYDNKTAEDQTMTMDHLVIISDLDVSKAYHLRAISNDASLNKGISEDAVIITKKASQNALNLILNTLGRSFWFLGNLFKLGS